MTPPCEHAMTQRHDTHYFAVSPFSSIVRWSAARLSANQAVNAEDGFVAPKTSVSGGDTILQYYSAFHSTPLYTSSALHRADGAQALR